MLSRVFTARPTILGIDHDAVEPVLKAQKGVISSFVDAGARSVGLELCPRILKLAGHVINSFTAFAQYASSHHLEVVPLLSDEVTDVGMPYGILTGFITPSSSFDIEMIDQEVVRLERQVSYYEKRLQSRYTPPEIASPALLEATQLRLQRMKTAKTYAQGFDGDLDAFARLWQEWIVLHQEEVMTSVIRAKRPDLVIIGAAHALSLSIEGYEVDIRRDLGKDLRLPNIVGAPFLRETLQEFASKRSKESASAVYHYLRQTTLDSSVRSDQVDAYLEQKLLQQPDLLFWAMRVLYHRDFNCMVDFFPYQDIRYFKMTALEAENRIHAALSVLP